MLQGLGTFRGFVAAIGAAVVALPSPVAQAGAPADDMLDKPFTIVYDFTIHDVRSKAVKDKVLAEDVKMWQQRLDADQVSKQQMDDAIAREKAGMAKTTKKGRLTLTFDGHTLVVDDWHPGAPDGERVIMIRGGQTYVLRPGNPRSTSIRAEGVASYGLDEVPIIGPSLPFMPNARDGQVLILRATPDIRTAGKPNRLEYGTGQVMKTKAGLIKRVRFGSGSWGDSMDLSDHVPFRGCWIAKTINWTLNDYLAGPPARSAPSTKLHFKLVSILPSPMPVGLYDPGHFLQDGSEVQLDVPKGRARSFSFSKGKGSFDDQAKAALAGSQ